MNRTQILIVFLFLTQTNLRIGSLIGFETSMAEDRGMGKMHCFLHN